MVCATGEVLGDPAHLCSVARAFAVCTRTNRKLADVKH